MIYTTFWFKLFVQSKNVIIDETLFSRNNAFVIPRLTKAMFSLRKYWSLRNPWKIPSTTLLFGVNFYLYFYKISKLELKNKLLHVSYSMINACFFSKLNRFAV